MTLVRSLAGTMHVIIGKHEVTGTGTAFGKHVAIGTARTYCGRLLTVWRWEWVIVKRQRPCSKCARAIDRTVEAFRRKTR